jgi:osmoprotectant transport system permease protein
VTQGLGANANPLIRWDWVRSQRDQIEEAFLQHLELTFSAIFYGFLISIALAALALRYRWTLTPVTAFTGFLYTIPSVALFGILVPYTGLTSRTAIIALTSYTLLILVTNIVAGFRSIPSATLEAANGMGLTRRRRILTVELPLAMPYIITGLRIATVTTVGLVTVAAIIGQGGLGRLILDGLQRAFWTPMVVGASLSVLLALALDLILFGIGWFATPWARRAHT